MPSTLMRRRSSARPWITGRPRNTTGAVKVDAGKIADEGGGIAGGCTFGGQACGIENGAPHGRGVIGFRGADSDFRQRGGFVVGGKNVGAEHACRGQSHGNREGDGFSDKQHLSTPCSDKKFSIRGGIA
jgi:hypothetical protein